MAGDHPFPFAGKDPFSSFWQDFTSRMMAAGMPAQPQNPSVEMLNNMRRMFFDSLARHSEEFMKSEQFLQGMKQAMDAGLAWQQTINQSMQKTLSAAQMPTRGDTDHIALLVRGLEDRLLSRIEELSDRVASLESEDGVNAKPGAAPRRAAKGKNARSRRSAE